MTLEFRNSVPEPLAPISFDIPRPSAFELSNGLRVIIFEDPRLPIVSLRLAFFSGDIHDPSDATGLTSAMASMLTEGTEEYSSRQLAEKIERLGASLSATATDDFTIVAASSLSLYSEDILSLMAEVVLRPNFPDSELDLYKRNTVEHLKFQRSQPPFLANEQASRLIYGSHPYATVSPKAADIEKLDRSQLERIHRQRMIPNNAVLIAVGDVKREELIAQLEHHFSDWPAGTATAANFPDPPVRDARTLTIIDRPGSAQSNIMLGNSAVRRDHPDYFPLLVMNQVLGAGASSRIFMNLREEKGYTYGAYTRLNTKRLAGDLEATAEVRNEVTGASLKEFFFEFDRIRNELVGVDELNDAKNFLTGVFPIRAETQEGLTNLIVNQYLYDLPEDYLQTYREHVLAVTPSDVERVANEYVRPDEMAIVIVGDESAISGQAAEYASSVEIFDTEGNKKQVPASV